jgi:uncharacterized protein
MQSDRPKKEKTETMRAITLEDFDSSPGLRQDLLRIYERTRTIAVVGASADEQKAAYAIPSYLRSQGYRIIPVNPKAGEILGEHVYPSLEEIDAPVDVVDVFRPPAEAETTARQAIAIGADVLWFQPGTHTTEAIQLAADVGLSVVAGRCMGATHSELGLGSGPSAIAREGDQAPNGTRLRPEGRDLSRSKGGME